MKKSSAVLSSIVMIIAGILLFFFPVDALKSAVRVLGIAVLLYGVFGVIGFARAKGEERSPSSLIVPVIAVLAGIFLLASPGTVLAIFPIAAGILIIICGIQNLMQAFSAKKSGAKSWKLMLILSLISVLLGILVLFNPFGTEALLVRIFAVILVYNGVVGLFGRA